MAGISHLNIVVQQGSSAQDVHHIRQQTTEHAQLVTAQQEAVREANLKGKVPETEASDNLKFKREESKEKKERQQLEEEEKKKRKDKEKEMTLTGKLLDTVA